jgi:hypothetical protein
MKFIRGKENQIVNLEFVRVIDIHEIAGKQEVQADMGEYSIVLADFEHISHAKDYLDKLWHNTFDDSLGKFINEPQESLSA